MRDLVAWMLGLGLAANGLVMLGFPVDWYATVPGVAEGGPFNAHFIRDIGVAYLVSGAALVWLAVNRGARPAAQAGAAFLALHALVHVWDAAADAARPSIADRSADRLSAAGTGNLDCLYACPPRRNLSKRRSTMISWFLRRWVDEFERTWNYDASYLRDLLDADPRAAMAFSKAAASEQLSQGRPARRIFCRRHSRHHVGGLRTLHAAGDRYGATLRHRPGRAACCRVARSHRRALRSSAGGALHRSKLEPCPRGRRSAR